LPDTICRTLWSKLVNSSATAIIFPAGGTHVRPARDACRLVLATGLVNISWPAFRRTSADDPLASFPPRGLPLVSPDRVIALRLRGPPATALVAVPFSL